MVDFQSGLNGQFVTSHAVMGKKLSCDIVTTQCQLTMGWNVMGALQCLRVVCCHLVRVCLVIFVNYAFLKILKMYFL